MSDNIAYVGNKGDKSRSDCLVTFEPKDSGGINLEINGEGKVISRQQVEELAKKVLMFFNIEHAYLKIDDKGAPPLVLTARIEAAIKKIIYTDKEYLLPIIEENLYKVQKDRFRFSMLYIPGNTPKMMLNAGTHNPNSVIMDMEDSVVIERKHEGRILVRNALRGIDFNGAERMVRINKFPKGIDDLQYIVPHNIHVILIPKCEGAEHIQKIENEINKICQQKGIENGIYLMPIIESALGVEKAFEIASASENVIALAIGLEDYTADIGVKRTNEAKESFYARTRIVNACKAARIQAIDSVFSDIGDEEGLKETVRESKSLGFNGIGCIHPKQIQIVHENFAPDQEEIQEAMKIVNAYYEAEEKGQGVVSFNGKMIDPPVVRRAQKTIDLARYMGLINEH
jgi:citrate lyase subunit beta/citryl-CoA lyase